MRQRQRADESVPQRGEQQAVTASRQGVAEGACRHLVKDRLEQTGMRWTVNGAQAMLHTRAVYLNGQWDDLVDYHIQTEQTALYWRTAA